MSRYDPLKRSLQAQDLAQVTMSFQEIERKLGFLLPASARRHQAWWANSRGTHVQSAAWLDAGWTTSALDLGGERVTFVRGRGGSSSPGAPVPPDAAPGFSSVREADPAVFVMNRDDLTPAARRLLQTYADEQGASLGQAAALALNEAARERKLRILEWFAERSPRLTSDSVDLIREDRDAR